MSGPDTKRIADETRATIDASVRELAKLLDGKAAVLSIRTKYDKTIVFDVLINDDLPSLILCAIDTHASLTALLNDVHQRVAKRKASGS